MWLMTVLRHMLRDELLSSSDITMLSGFIQLRGMLIFYLAFLRHLSHCSPMTFFLSFKTIVYFVPFSFQFQNVDSRKDPWTERVVPFHSPFDGCQV